MVLIASASLTDEVTTLEIALPNETLEAIDEAVEKFHPVLADRKTFIELAVGYALKSCREDAETLTLALEDE